jgi:hypothetical protein
MGGGGENDWPITKKKVQTMEPPQNRRFYGKIEFLPIWPTYLGEKGRTLGKTYGIKVRCYWEHHWGTYWELRECIDVRFWPMLGGYHKYPWASPE